MLFHLKPDTECELTSFVGRTQKSGPDDVPAVTFRLKLASVRNELLDLFSPTMRHTVYAPVEGQEQLPGVEVTTPILRSKDLNGNAQTSEGRAAHATAVRGSETQMTIVQRDQVRAAVERALQLDPNRDMRAAIASTAQALCLPVEAVEEVVIGVDGEVSA
jgi:hypothetical protein